jgi:hypothetical protein
MIAASGVDEKTGLRYHEYYLYSEKEWEMAPIGAESFSLAYPVLQNAPVVITPSGYETTTADDPWAKTSGTEKYTKVGYGYFGTNTKEFSLSPSSSGTIVFNGPLCENVYIEYEAGPSGYYIYKSVDYNPIRNEAEGGFLHFSKVTDPDSIVLTASRSSMRADGQQGCKLTAIVYDEDYDRVPGASVVFEIQELKPPCSGSLGVWSEFGYLVPNVGSVETGAVDSLTDGSFEDWIDINHSTNWLEVGAGAVVVRTLSAIESDAYSVELSASGVEVAISQDISSTLGLDYWKSKNAELGCWVYATSADAAYININDGVSDTSSSYHSGASRWEFITVEKALSSSATTVKAQMLVKSGKTAYFDGAKLIVPDDSVDASGYQVRTVETTNSRGEAYTNYVTHLGKTGIPRIKAYDQNASGVYGEAGFYQFYLQSNPFYLDQSQLDTMDYLYS